MPNMPFFKNVAFSLLDRLELDSVNEDPLGFFTYATRLAEEWLPGITTRTRRIRYYTIICGGLLLIEDEFKDLLRSAVNRDEETARLFMRWERLWAIWNGSVEESKAGMIGKNMVSDLFKDDYFVCGSVNYKFIQRQPDLGALGSYRSSMEALGLLKNDCLQLTPDGRTLGQLFWSQAKNNRARNHSLRALKNGKISFPRSRDRLAEYAAKFGLDVLGQEIKEEKSFIKDRLIPKGNATSRRSLVVEYVRNRGWSGYDEYSILSKAAKRGSSANKKTVFLERCAATIVALEEFRTATLALLNAFRDHLFLSGHADTPKALSKKNIRKIVKNVNLTHRAILRFVRSAEFQEVFRGFPMVECRTGQDEVEWLRELLKIHKKEMARRRTPKWFYPAGGGKWALDSSIVGSSSRDEELAPYSYRTNNLLNMAREVGCRV